MNHPSPRWICDGLDPGWFVAEGLSSVHSAVSYRPGGWWFLPAWLPDSQEHDVGPFRTEAHAQAAAEDEALTRRSNR